MPALAMSCPEFIGVEGWVFFASFRWGEQLVPHCGDTREPARNPDPPRFFVSFVSWVKKFVKIRVIRV